jgi:hypothetical protein
MGGLYTEKTCISASKAFGLGKDVPGYSAVIDSRELVLLVFALPFQMRVVS